MLLFCAISVAFIYYMQHLDSKVDFSKSTLYVLTVFIYQNQLNFKIKTFIQRMVYFLIFLNGFILTNLYMAKLSSLLVQTIYESKIEKLKELNNTKHQLIVRQVDYDFLHRFANVPKFILQKLKVVESDVIYKANRYLNNTNLLMASEDIVNFHLFQQKFLKYPRMYKINDVLYNKPDFLTVRKDLPYLQLFNRFLKYVMESGILKKLILETNFDGIHSGEIRFFTDSVRDLYLDFEYFYAPLCFYAIGMILSLSVLILELIYFRFFKK